jgi:tetratricopeptide (TPR) repeat protein
MGRKRASVIRKKKALGAVVAAQEPPPPTFATTSAELDYYKSRGNMHFGRSSNILAIECYTKALRCEPSGSSLAALLSNRSAALLKVHQHEEALADAERCVQEAPTWAKGYFRKGKALAKLVRVHEAEGVFSEGLNLDEASEELQYQVRQKCPSTKD